MPDDVPVLEDDKLGPRQLLGMQRLDDTVRAGLLDRDSAEAAYIEHLVRTGKVSTALKRVSAVRRNAR